MSRVIKDDEYRVVTEFKNLILMLLHIVSDVV
jgi:hypothetical protein